MPLLHSPSPPCAPAATLQVYSMDGPQVHSTAAVQAAIHTEGMPAYSLFTHRLSAKFAAGAAPLRSPTIATARHCSSHR
jgi:hypothetical protein